MIREHADSGVGSDRADYAGTSDRRIICPGSVILGIIYIVKANSFLEKSGDDFRPYENLSSTDRMILYPFHSCRRVIRRPAIPSLCPGRGWPVHPRGRNKSGTEQDVPGRVHVPVHCYSAVRTFMNSYGEVLLHGLPADGA